MPATTSAHVGMTWLLGHSRKRKSPNLLQVPGKVVILQHITNLTMDGPNESEVL